MTARNVEKKPENSDMPEETSPKKVKKEDLGELCKINQYDIQMYLRDGGKIKDLINPAKFNKLY